MLAGGAVAAAALLAFAPAIGNGFVDWDDPETIVENAALRADLGTGVAAAWREPKMGLYVPLTYSLWTVIARAEAAVGLAGPGGAPHPLGFHALNIALHVLASLLVFALLGELVGGVAAPALGALLFAVHPVQVEAVAWASGTKDVLATALGVALLAHGRGRSLAAIALYVAALLAKPAAVSLPLAVFAIDVLLRERPWRASLRAVAPWLLIALPFAIGTRAAQIATAPRAEIDPWLRPGVALDALVFYFGKLVHPVNLAPDYGVTATMLAGSSERAWIVLLVLSASLLAARGVLRRRLALAAALFVIALLPVLGLVPSTYHAISIVADRYVYPAMLGPALAIAALAATQPPWRIAIAAVALAAIAIPATRAQTRVWRDTETLFLHTLEVNPGSVSAQVALAKIADEAGDSEEALARYTRALAADPPPTLRARVEGNLGLLLLHAGRRDEALPLLSRAHEALPAEPVLALNLGSLLAQAGDASEAARVYERTLAATFDAAVANDLAWLLATTSDPALRDPARAVSLAERAAAIDRRAHVLDTLAVAIAASGSFDRAQAVAAEAVAAARREGQEALAAEIEARAVGWKAAPPP